MSSQLRVDNILPSAGTALGIGTASGSITFNSSNISGDVIFNDDVTVNGLLTYEDVTNIDSVGIITARSGLQVTGGSVGIGTTNPSVIFHSYHPTTNTVGKFESGDASVNIRFRDGDTTNEMGIGALGNDFIVTAASGGERVRVTSAGNVGINSTIPRSKLHVASGTSGYNTGNPTGLGAGAIASIESNGTVGLQFLSGNSHNNYIYFGDTNSATTGSIQYSHGANALIFNVNGGTERLRITSAGQVNINASSESIGGKVLIKNNVDYTTTDFDDDPTLYLLNGDQTTGVSEAAILLAGRNTSGSTYRAAISGNGFSGIKFHPSNNAEQDHTAAMTIAGTHRVGINVDSPEDPLHVKNTSNAATSIRIQTGTSSTNNGDEYSSIIFDGNGYVGAKIASHRDDGTWNDRGDLRFYSGYGNNVFTERMRITNTGLMGLGTLNPGSYVGGGENLVIADSDDAGMTIASGTSNSGTINFADGTSGDARYRGRVEYSHSLDALDILTAATTQIRIDNSGRVLLGTLNSTGTQLIKVNGDTSATTNGGHIALTQGRTSPGNGATHGLITFGTETRPEVVKVVGFVDGTWTDGQYHPSGLYISTTDYNRNSPTEKIRITDIGEINCYSSGACIQAGTLQGGGYNVYFYEGRRNQNTGGTRTYIVWSNGNVQNTNNSYGSLSDQRLKENIVDATSQWDDIKSLQIRKYNFREATGNETHTQIGLIAQEVESVSPGLVQTTAVSEGEVLQDADGNQIESVKSINYSVLYMKSVKALQEAQTRIEALEAAVAALQGS